MINTSLQNYTIRATYNHFLPIIFLWAMSFNIIHWLCAIYFLSCQKATAAAAATLRESTPCFMGMRTT